MTKYLTAKDVAKMAGCHYTNVARWLRDGVFPAKKKGRVWQVTPVVAQQIVAYAQERRGNFANLNPHQNWTWDAYCRHAARSKRNRREKLSRAIREIRGINRFKEK